MIFRYELLRSFDGELVLFAGHNILQIKQKFRKHERVLFGTIALLLFESQIESISPKDYVTITLLFRRKLL